MSTQATLILFNSADGIGSLSHFIQKQLITLHLLLRQNVNKYTPPPPNIPTRAKIKVSSNHIGKVIYIIIKYIYYIIYYESKTDKQI